MSNYIGPDEATEYLNNVQWKKFLEYLSAEVVVHRPEDPLKFVRGLIDNRINERPTSDFNPTQIHEYLNNTYEDIKSHADIYGRLEPRAVQASSQDTVASDEIERLTRENKRWQVLFEAMGEILTKLDPQEAIDSIIASSCLLMNSDRATIFKTDHQTNELVLFAAEGATGIRVPVGKGIAGTVAETGEITMINDCYKDERFDQSYDRKSGYKTNSLLTAPNLTIKGETIGVIQVVNKKIGHFDGQDEEFIACFSLLAGISISNAQLYDNSTRVNEKLRSLIAIIQAMQADLGINSLLFTLATRIPSVIEAERCNVYIVDHKLKELFSIQGEDNVKLPLGVGIPGKVAESKEIMNISDAYSHPMFNKESDKNTGHVTKTILCMPVIHKEEVVGIVQLFNKSEGVFTDEDVSLLTVFFNVAAPFLAASHMAHHSANGNGSDDEGNEFEGITHPRSSSGDLRRSLEALGEDGEEEEEDE